MGLPKLNNHVCCADSGAGIGDGCRSESRIRQNLNLRFGGCKSENGYGCGDSAKLYYLNY